jgi:hypothetical protein
MLTFSALSVSLLLSSFSLMRNIKGHRETSRKRDKMRAIQAESENVAPLDANVIHT